MKRIDERDTMFARMALEPGTWQYDEYYAAQPEKQARDDAIRHMPGLCSPGTATYHPLNAPIAEANFAFLGDIRHLAESEPEAERVAVDKADMSAKLKGLSQVYGARLAGICRMSDDWFYSHRGRHPEVYAQVVDPSPHRYGLVYAVEMDRAMINRSPLISEVIATSHGYVAVAIVGLQLAYYIRSLGYFARVHMDASYLAVLPPVAEAAGLGEIGRNSLLTTRDYGSRVRLGLVTTELELVPDEPIRFGLERFCQLCGRCAANCPARAIPMGDKPVVAGKARWQTDQVACYTSWRRVGTDCGICISSCPFSQPMTKTSFATDEEIEQALAEFDQRYGKRPFIAKPPDWL